MSKCALQARRFLTTDKAYHHIITRSHSQRRVQRATTKAYSGCHCSQNRTASAQSSGQAANEPSLRILAAEQDLL